MQKKSLLDRIREYFASGNGMFFLIWTAITVVGLIIQKLRAA